MNTVVYSILYAIGQDNMQPCDEHACPETIREGFNDILRSKNDNQEFVDQESKNNDYELVGQENTSNDFIVKYSLTSYILFVLNEIFYSGNMSNYQKWLKVNSMFSQRALTTRHIFYSFLFIIDIILRGIAQVFLCNHPISAIFICFGLACTSFKLLAYSLLGTTFATIGAMLAAPPSSEIESGLCGYDGALVGGACLEFLDTENITISVLTASILSFTAGFVHSACNNYLKTFGLPPFTFSFNLITMAFLLSIKGGTSTVARFHETASSSDSNNWTEMSFLFIWDASFRGVGQFMFVSSTYGGALVILGICISSPRAAAAAWCGSLIGCLGAYYIIQVPSTYRTAVRNGLYGYNSAGVCAAIAGGVFYIPSYQSQVLGGFGALLAVLVMTSLQTIFMPLPILTFPFIITASTIMMARSKYLKLL